MPKIIISDTSCFILLKNIGELELLEKIYKQIITTPEIALEFGEELPNWVQVISVNDKLRQQLLEIQIDKGESSAIALALEIPNSVLILDDNKARKIAKQLGLTFTGTIGVIIRAKLDGIIPSIIPIIEKIRFSFIRRY